MTNPSPDPRSDCLADAEDLQDLRAAREESTDEASLTLEEVKQELGLL